MSASWTTDPPTSRRHALNTIRMLMEFWGLTSQDLERALADAPGPPVPTEPTPQVKYRHPRTGATWDGQGAQPGWLREALTREGYTVAELRVAANGAANEAATEPVAEPAAEVPADPA